MGTGALHIGLILLEVCGSEGVVTVAVAVVVVVVVVVVEDGNSPCPCSFVCSPCWDDCPDGHWVCCDSL